MTLKTATMERWQQGCPHRADLLNQVFTVAKLPAQALANSSQYHRHPGSLGMGHQAPQEGGAGTPPRN